MPVVGLLNGHCDARRVAVPVYASESHAGFQHWLLHWLLRTINIDPAALPPPHKVHLTPCA